MDETLKGLDSIFVYLDDILVASHSRQKHLILLRLIFEHLQHSGLAINLAKCEIRFVPSAAKIMQPLYTALKGTPKTLNWTK